MGTAEPALLPEEEDEEGAETITAVVVLLAVAELGDPVSSAAGLSVTTGGGEAAAAAGSVGEAATDVSGVAISAGVSLSSDIEDEKRKTAAETQGAPSHTRGNKEQEGQVSISEEEANNATPRWFPQQAESPPS
jgi:hypothetical protein